MNRPARRGTLASIAAELGVSRTTVSNAYNRPDQLSPELREKILRTAQRLGYPGPDPTARSLRTRRAGAIGVLLTEELTYAFEDQASVEFMSGVSVACGKMESSMLLIPAGVDGSAPSAKPTTLVNQASVDGFVVYSVAADDPFLAAVLNRNLPTVVCDQPAKDHQLSFVGIDDHAAIQPVVRQLVEAGHRQVGMLCIRLDREPNDGPVSPERLAGAQMHVQRSRIEGALEVLEKAGVDVRLNTSVTPEMLETEFRGWEIIAAAGAKANIIPAFTCFKNWMRADDILAGKAFPGQNTGGSNRR